MSKRKPKIQKFYFRLVYPKSPSIEVEAYNIIDAQKLAVEEIKKEYPGWKISKVFNDNMISEEDIILYEGYTIEDIVDIDIGINVQVEFDEGISYSTVLHFNDGSIDTDNNQDIFDKLMSDESHRLLRRGDDPTFAELIERFEPSLREKLFKCGIPWFKPDNYDSIEIGEDTDT